MRNPINARGMILAALATLVASASADLVANFDTFTEGQVFDSFSDGYIFFSNVYRHQDPYTNFAIEDASSGGLGNGFTFPNALGFGGYVPGQGFGFGAFGGMSFTSQTPARTAGLDLWTFPLDMGGNTITLTGFLGGSIVDSVSVLIPNSFTLIHHRLDLPTDDYDRFQLTSNGPTVQGDSFILVDNVSIAAQAVPEPATWAVGLGMAVLLRRKRRD